MSNIPLIIQPGLVSDDTTYSRKGAWSDVDKVRFWRGFPQTIGGWESFSGDLLGGVCRTIFVWTDTLGEENTAFGTHQTLEVSYGGGLYDITPATDFTPGLVDGTGGLGYGSGAYSEGEYSEPSTDIYYPLTWSLSAYGENLIANPRGQGIFRWENVTATPAALVPNAPDEVTYALVTQTRQVMAFGCNEEVSGDFNPLCIRFSNVEDPEDWATSPSNLAGEVIIDGPGRIVAARLIGEYIYVWTDNALYLGQFTGNPTQPWRFDKQGSNCGLLGPNAAWIVGQKAFWVGTNTQFYAVGMGGEPQLIVSPVQTEFSNNLSLTQADKIVASGVSEFGEVWFFYPDSRDGIENSRYLALSTLDGLWSRGTLARTAFVDSGPNISPLGVTYEGQIYLHERGNSADGSAFDWYMETADQYIGEADTLYMVRGIWPDFKDQQGVVCLDFYSRLYPQGPQRQKGSFVLAPNKNRKDFLVQSRIMKLRISGNAAPTFCRLGKPELDAVETSRR